MSVLILKEHCKTSISSTRDKITEYVIQEKNLTEYENLNIVEVETSIN